ncbi:hypothetical protein SASPL_131904 [Salvia splendens]|uniref:Disease resistance R13L4/SHOC-2-like LRR domain-containing protein n=1 Tax=Salvia splendens TaxID=180675 RepID=A0A8X8X8P7_SALSN|nr:hypothetical protein SASPL_131904 [Salvia splendens]
MAAYSAVTVFWQTLEQLLDSDQFPPHVSKTQIISLRENICSLQSSLDKISFVPKLKRDKMKDLQTRIREAIYAAQDEVEYWIRGHSPTKSDEKTIQKLEEDIKLVENDAVEMEREIRNDTEAQNLFLESDAQPLFNFNGNDKIVGQEEDFKNVLEELDALVNLIGRNLISVSEISSSGGIKVCSIQSSLRKLAEIESGKEKFFHCRKKYKQQLEEGTKFQRRVSVHINPLMSLENVYKTTKTITSARSLLYLGPHHHHPLPFCLTFDLLRVLDAFIVYFVEFPDEFLQLVHLTYLSLTYNDEIPPEISLQKLQVLMVRRIPKLIFIGVSFLPDEIWEMPVLQHLWFTETDFPALPQNIPQHKALLLNLQTLSHISAASCTRDVLRSMPSLKKLSMWAEAPGVIGLYLDKLKQLEAFKFIVLHLSPKKQVEFEPEISFPQTLRKLSLSGIAMSSDIEFIGPLRLIELVDCSPQAVESAEVIKQEQEVYYERKDFQVRIYCSYV